MSPSCLHQVITEGKAIQTPKYAVILSQNVHFVTTLLVPLIKKLVLQKLLRNKHLYRKCHGDHLIWNHLVTKCSFCHNLTETTKQKTDLTKVVKEYPLIKQMLWRPINMESIGHKMFILSQPYWCL